MAIDPTRTITLTRSSFRVSHPSLFLPRPTNTDVYSNGSYYYSNPNGSTYYNNGSGGSTYTPPSGDKK
jgi:hypothetical protein